MKRVVDTRFLIEFFYASNEDIRRKAKAKLGEITRSKEGILPTIVIGEVIKVTCERRGLEEAKIRYISLLQSGLIIEPLNPEIAENAGILRCKYRNVPIGDCIIAATALKHKAIIVSDDPHFDLIKEVKCEWI